jgi:hypothetical protein
MLGKSAFSRALAACLLLMSPGARAHTMMMTEVLVSFGRPGTADVKVDVDLTVLLGSPQRYYEVAIEPPPKQQEDIRRILPQLLENVQLFVGPERLSLTFRGFSAAAAPQAEYLDASLSKLSTLRFVAAIPPEAGPLRLVVPLGAQIDYPVAYTVQVPARHLSITRWLEEGVHESGPIEWQTAPQGASASATRFDPDRLAWPAQLALYLRLGFRHIVPEGADHILFVLGLFFLGITWRKLLWQTTVFTVAHATTLFLSTYGVFRLPGRYVEPAIALSIAVIAAENIMRPRLGPGRLALVFAFGLIHGLGFASSLSEVPFPRRDFLVALLGFNFGVDFGQLFVIALAFLLVGAFRHEPWFRARVAIPCSALIATVGCVWAMQRALYYYGAS